MMVCAVVLLSVSGRWTFAIAEPIEIRVPLDKDGRYDVDKLLEQCNRALGTQFAIEPYRGRKLVLSPSERAALLLANELGVFTADITAVQLTLTFPDDDDAQRGQLVREQLRRWLKLPSDYWTASHGLKVPDDFDPQRRTLLVVPGLEAGPADMKSFEKACHAEDVQLLQFLYPNDGPLAAAGNRLNKELSDLAQYNSDLQVAVVGLSMGGLVARYSLELPGMKACGVTDLFLVGTPHGGSALAGEQGLLELAFQILPGGVRGFRDSFADGLGEAADDLQPGSPFLTKLGTLPRPVDIRYHVGIGTRSFISAEQREAILADMDRIFAARNVSPGLRQELRALLAADELKDGAGDGAVTVRSAQLPGAHCERFFALNHSQLISLSVSRPEESEVFRWILAELDWHNDLSGRTLNHE